MSLRILSCSKAVSLCAARHRFGDPVLRARRVVKGTSRDYFILAVVSRSCCLRAQTDPACRSSRKSQLVRRLLAHCHAFIRHTGALRGSPSTGRVLLRRLPSVPGKPHLAGLVSPVMRRIVRVDQQPAHDIASRLSLPPRRTEEFLHTARLTARARTRCRSRATPRELAPIHHGAQRCQRRSVRASAHASNPNLRVFCAAAKTSSEIKDLRGRLDRRCGHGMSNGIFLGCGLYNAGRLTTLEFPGADPGWMPFGLIWTVCRHLPD